MRNIIELSERIRGRYDHVPAILRLDFDQIVREPLDELRVPVGRSLVGRRVDAHVGPMRAAGTVVGRVAGRTEIPVGWRAAEHPRLFPTMTGSLRIAERGADAIEVQLRGTYRPPLGVLGALVDRVAGRRAVEVSLHAYLREVSGRLEAALTQHAPHQPNAARPGAIERSP